MVPGTSGGSNSGAGSNHGVSLSVGSASYSYYSELEPTPSKLSHNRRELKAEDVEEEVTFEAMQEHLNIYDMEDVANEDALAPAYEAIVLTAQAEETLYAAQQQLDQAVLATSLSTVQAEVVRRRAIEEEAAAREQRRAATLRAAVAIEAEGEGPDIIVLSSSDDEDRNNDDDGTIVLPNDEDK